MLQKDNAHFPRCVMISFFWYVMSFVPEIYFKQRLVLLSRCNTKTFFTFFLFHILILFTLFHYLPLLVYWKDYKTSEGIERSLPRT